MRIIIEPLVSGDTLRASWEWYLQRLADPTTDPAYLLEARDAVGRLIADASEFLVTTER